MNEQQQTAIDYLNRVLMEAKYVVTMITSHSPDPRSTRSLVRVLLAPQSGEIVEVTWAVARALGKRTQESSYGYGIPVNGVQVNKAILLRNALQQALGYEYTIAMVELR